MATDAKTSISLCLCQGLAVQTCDRTEAWGLPTSMKIVVCATRTYWSSRENVQSQVHGRCHGRSPFSWAFMETKRQHADGCCQVAGLKKGLRSESYLGGRQVEHLPQLVGAVCDTGKPGRILGFIVATALGG